MHIDSNPIVDKRLYAFWFDGDNGNIYSVTMEQLYDREWLWNFFKANEKDLAFFKIAEINEAIERTIDDLEKIDDFFLDGDFNLDGFFQELSINWQDTIFKRSKGKLSKHKSWVRFYSIKIEPNIYILTGGTIKLTATMQERKHTRSQLEILERCHNYLIGQGFCDFDGFYEFINENDIKQWIIWKNWKAYHCLLKPIGEKKHNGAKIIAAGYISLAELRSRFWKQLTQLRVCHRRFCLKK